VNLIDAEIAASKAARAAGAVMRDNWHLPKKVNKSEAHDIKLELDVRCQALIEKMLARAFPQIPVLGEEGSTGDTSDEYRWVIDPIDGTVNYASGLPHAAVSIALQSRSDLWRAAADARKGPWKRRARNFVTRDTSHVSVVGVVYDPFTDELWTTTAGKPARLNGRVVHVSGQSRIANAVVALGFAKSKESLEKSLPYLDYIVRRAKKVRIMGSAALELTYVASGRMDAYVERDVNLWDVAAGALLLENAGGEYYALRAPGGKLRMCADNGKLRKKLRAGDLLN
jgi:myo-inositol-1(or 4)-monophosphatase